MFVLTLDYTVNDPCKVFNLVFLFTVPKVKEKLNYDLKILILKLTPFLSYVNWLIRIMGQNNACGKFCKLQYQHQISLYMFSKIIFIYVGEYIDTTLPSMISVFNTFNYFIFSTRQIMGFFLFSRLICFSSTNSIDFNYHTKKQDL